MKYFLLNCFLLAFLFSSCLDRNEEYEQKIVGKWVVENWEVERTGEKINGQMDFTFEENGRYALDYGDATENGRFWIIQDILHTQAEGESEIIVKITKLVQDSLSLEMNRGGIMEKVELKRSR